MTEILISCLILMVCWNVLLYGSKIVLQKTVNELQLNLITTNIELAAIETRLNSVETAQIEELNQEQRDFKEQLESQYLLLFEQLKHELATKQVEEKANFDKLLKESFEKACSKINFEKIEYKKTITKKRKEFSRKNSHLAKPAPTWRLIDEE